MNLSSSQLFFFFVFIAMEHSICMKVPKHFLQSKFGVSSRRNRFGRPPRVCAEDGLCSGDERRQDSQRQQPRDETAMPHEKVITSSEDGQLSSTILQDTPFPGNSIDPKSYLDEQFDRTSSRLQWRSIPVFLQPPPKIKVAVYGRREDLGSEFVWEDHFDARPNMQVIEAIRSAGYHIRNHGNEQAIPFQVLVVPNTGCLTIDQVNDMGNGNGNRHLWTLIVKDNQQRVIYTSQCLPTGLFIYPGYEVILTNQQSSSERHNRKRDISGLLQWLSRE